MLYILLILGFTLLVKGADVFVDGSVGAAERFNVPSFIIGLTIVAMGTSAPEAAVSITAALSGANEIATGNVIGSNIFNILVVLGVCAAIKPIQVDFILLKRDFPLNIVTVLVMLLFSLDFTLSRTSDKVFSRADGIILLAFFVLYMLLLTVPEARKNLRSPGIPQNNKKQNKPLLPALLKIIVGLVGIILGGKFVVDSASDLAVSFGISSNVVGLTVVAVGTSLPELITSIVASMKGESDMAVGNVLGSNMFNILFVLGASCAIHPIAINPVSIYDLFILLAITLVSLFFFWTHRTLNRMEAAIMLILYAIYTTFIIMR